VPDLRGTGRSRLIGSDAALAIEALFGDLDRLRLAVGVDGVAVVGHSFGATLALLSAAARPGAVSGAALVGLGALDGDAADRARARLIACVPPDRRADWATARRLRKEAAERGDAEAFRHASLTQMEISLPAFVLDADAGRRLIEARRPPFGHSPAVHRRSSLISPLSTSWRPSTPCGHRCSSCHRVETRSWGWPGGPRRHLHGGRHRRPSLNRHSTYGDQQ
jgi:pimeloyl-ACP methyl ester carboxylesterase